MSNLCLLLCPTVWASRLEPAFIDRRRLFDTQRLLAVLQLPRPTE